MLRRIDTPGVFAAIEYAMSQAARTRGGIVVDERVGFCNAAPCDAVDALAMLNTNTVSTRDAIHFFTLTLIFLNAVNSS